MRWQQEEVVTDSEIIRSLSQLSQHITRTHSKSFEQKNTAAMVTEWVRLETVSIA